MQIGHKSNEQPLHCPNESPLGSLSQQRFTGGKKRTQGEDDRCASESASRVIMTSRVKVRK